MSTVRAWEARSSGSGAERAWQGSRGLQCCKGLSAVQCWGAVVSRAWPERPRGSSPPCSERSHQPSLAGVLSSPVGSARSSSAGANPARLYKAPAGPFGKRISFFLDAFPDLGVMEGLRAARARARLREEEPDEQGPQPLAREPWHPLFPLEPWPGGLSVKSATSARIRLTVSSRCHRSRRRRSLQRRKEPGLGTAEPRGTER